MSAVVRYHPGGLNPDAPQQNRAELYDGATGTYTSWDTAGTQTAARPLTAPETAALAAADAQLAATGNGLTLQQQAMQALATNRTYVALAAPTAAQTTAQVKALTRQNNGLIRLLLGQLDGTD